MTEKTMIKQLDYTHVMTDHRKLIGGTVKMQLTKGLLLVGLFALIPTLSVYASTEKEGGGKKVCYDAGYNDGRNGPFDSGKYYDDCTGEGEYEDGFIDGCMSISGNTRDICESATDS